MQSKSFSNFFLNSFLFRALLICLVGVSFSSVQAQQQQQSSITVDKTFCTSTGDSNTCTGRINNLNGTQVRFTVFDETANQSKPDIIVEIREGNGSQGSTRVDGFVRGNTFLVCEVVPPNFRSVPRPDQSTNGQQSAQGDCIRVTLGPGNNVLQFLNFRTQQSPPTAAPASISGRVVNVYGRALSKVRVVLTDSEGNTRITMTNSFGYYNFEDLPSGDTYIIGGFHRKYTIEPRVISLAEDLSEQDLIVREKE